MRVQAVILAAGQGTRFGTDKTQANYQGKPLWWHSYSALKTHPLVEGVGIVASSNNIEAIKRLAPDAAYVVLGGKTRQESSTIGITNCVSEIVLLQDAARPVVLESVVTTLIEALAESSGAAPAIPVTDTIRQQHSEDFSLLDRSTLFAMQTPQAVRRDDYLDAARQTDKEFTDDLAVLESAGMKIKLVPGDASMAKITYPQDLESSMNSIMEYRTGLGYDIHAFSTDATRTLVLGGISFPNEQALEGHSDADVIIHAVVDALLGAASLGDIGQHFPNTDERWKGAPSTIFLNHATSLLTDLGWQIVNIDIAVQAEKPKIMKRATGIRATLATQMQLTIDRVSIKATTNERLGAIGREEGIACFATATIRRLEP